MKKNHGQPMWTASAWRSGRTNYSRTSKDELSPRVRSSRRQTQSTWTGVLRVWLAPAKKAKEAGVVKLHENH
ncbi:unnamed protein product, partial [Ectocarpus sp. 6 AP-2014]